VVEKSIINLLLVRNEFDEYHFVKFLQLLYRNMVDSKKCGLLHFTALSIFSLLPYVS